MQLKDVTPIIKAILDERDKIPRIIDQERYIPNPQPYHDGNFMRGGIRKALRIIEQAPVVEAVPVVHARWEWGQGGWCCTACGKRSLVEAVAFAKYCPRCGAKMDGESDV